MIREKIDFNQIRDFVSKQTFNSKDTLTLQTRLGEDLCVMGDDADEFLDEFSKQFDVNLSTINCGIYQKIGRKFLEDIFKKNFIQNNNA